MEKNNNDLFELVTKMYSDMQDMKTDMQDMKTDMQDMKSEQKKTNEKLDNLENKVANGFVAINKRFDNLSENIGRMVTKEVGGEISYQVNSLKNDINFLIQKTTKTEKDVFVIQNHLKIIK